MWATSDALKRCDPTSDNGQARSAGRRRHYGLAGLMDAAAAERRRVHIRGEGPGATRSRETQIAPARPRSRRCTSCRVKSVPLQAGARAPAWSGELQRRQVAIEFPLSQLHPILVPLGALEPDVVVEDVVTEGLADELGPGQLVDRLAKGLRERDDPALAPLLRREVVQVRLHRGGQLVAALDPLEARVQQACERQIRVAGGIRAADLGPSRLLVARLVERDPDQRRAVSP